MHNIILANLILHTVAAVLLLGAAVIGVVSHRS